MMMKHNDFITIESKFLKIFSNKAEIFSICAPNMNAQKFSLFNQLEVDLIDDLLKKCNGVRNQYRNREEKQPLVRIITE